MKAQVKKDHYDFGKYVGLDRWSSYHYQLKEALKTGPKNILEIGVGDKVFSDYVKKHTNINCITLDIAEDLGPDIVGSIEKIPLEDKSVDTSCVFEVLEHLPFSKFEPALIELKRVTKKNICISLPHFGPMLSMRIKIPFFRPKTVSFKIPIHPKHIFNGEHYWEIGKSGYEIKKIKDVFKKHFTIEHEFIPYENPYHHFFILKI